MNKQKYYNDEDKLFLHHSSKVLYKKLDKKVREKDIKNFLRTQRNYTLFKQPASKKTRNPYTTHTIDELWQLDLVSIPSLAVYNSGVINLLVCIDVFSRFAFVRELNSKQPHEIVKNLMNIFKTHHRRPWRIESDAGREFVNKTMDSFLKNNYIDFRVVTTTLPAKCSYVERFNRTLKQRIMRYLNWKRVTDQPNPNRYIDALQPIVDDYNRTPHSVIKIAPIHVTRANSAVIYEKIRKRWTSVEQKQPKLFKGEFVRVKRKRETFEKESMKPVWSEQIFKIARSIQRKPYPVYEISTLKNNVVKGRLYEHELQPIKTFKNAPVEIVKHPNIFNKSMQVKTIDGKIRTIDYNKEKNVNKENNYADFISFLK